MEDSFYRRNRTQVLSTMVEPGASERPGNVQTNSRIPTCGYNPAARIGVDEIRNTHHPKFQYLPEYRAAHRMDQHFQGVGNEVPPRHEYSGMYPFASPVDNESMMVERQAGQRPSIERPVIDHRSSLYHRHMMHGDHTPQSHREMFSREPHYVSWAPRPLGELDGEPSPNFGWHEYVSGGTLRHPPGNDYPYGYHAPAISRLEGYHFHRNRPSTLEERASAEAPGALRFYGREQLRMAQAESVYDDIRVPVHDASEMPNSDSAERPVIVVKADGKRYRQEWVEIPSGTPSKGLIPKEMQNKKTEQEQAFAGSVPLQLQARKKIKAPKKCSHCGSETTPFWRTDKDTHEPLCNACGLYLKKCGVKRPKRLWVSESSTGNKVGNS